MKGSQEDFQTMAVVCDDYLADNAAIIAANPLMQELKTELHADILQVQTANQAKQKKSQGLTMDKEEKSDKAIDLIIELAGYGKVFARRTNNPDLLAQLKVNRTSLDILEDTELPDALRALHRNLAGIGVPGERYGISTPKLTAAMAAITDYEAAGPAPRQAIVERSTQGTQKIPGLQRRIRATLKDIDGIVPTYRATAPDFVTGWYQSRVIVNNHGNGGGTPAPAPPQP